MSDAGTYTLILAKEDFKFSSAHFTLFGRATAEQLHGHNYQVGVELSGSELDNDGLLADFPSVKSTIRAFCERLDSKTLIPGESPHLEVREEGGGVEVAFDDRFYRFPSDDVLILPLVNTTIEVFAKMLWDELVEGVAMPYIEILGVEVGETAGQSCWYRAPLPPSQDGAEARPENVSGRNPEAPRSG